MIKFDWAQKDKTKVNTIFSYLSVLFIIQYYLPYIHTPEKFGFFKIWMIAKTFITSILKLCVINNACFKLHNCLPAKDDQYKSLGEFLEYYFPFTSDLLV